MEQLIYNSMGIMVKCRIIDIVRDVYNNNNIKSHDLRYKRVFNTVKRMTKFKRVVRIYENGKTTYMKTY